MVLTWWPIEAREKEYFVIFYVTEIVTRQSFIRVKAFLLVKCNNSSKLIQIPLSLIPFGWSNFSNEYPFNYMF